jgi:putative phosphoesterase
MRLAILSDIHGNLPALQAVLADLEAQGGADKIWVLGDLAAFGAQPAECIQILRDLPNSQTIRGNTDRYLCYGHRPKFKAPHDEESWNTFAQRIARADHDLRWGMEHLTWAEAEFLLKLDSALGLEVEGFGWVLAYHAAPNDDESLLPPDVDEDTLADALLDAEGRLIFGGHTHLPMDRTVGYKRMVNPGSVGLPFDGDPRAAYLIASFTGAEVALTWRRVDYEREAALAQAEALGWPNMETLSRRLRTGTP